MENLHKCITIAEELESGLDVDSLAAPRLQRCLSEIMPLFDRLKSLQSPWGANTLSALEKLYESLSSTQSLLLVPSQNGDNSEELGALMIAIRQLWRRRIEMYLALQLQEALEKTNCRITTSTIFPNQALLHSAAYNINTPAVPTPFRN